MRVPLLSLRRHGEATVKSEIWKKRKSDHIFQRQKKHVFSPYFPYIFKVFIAVLSFRGVAGVKIIDGQMGMMSTGSGGFPLDATPSHPLDHRIFIGLSWDFPWINQRNLG